MTPCPVWLTCEYGRRARGDDLRQPLTSDDASFSEGGANCICLHAERDKDARQRIEQYLIRNPGPGSNA